LTSIYPASAGTVCPGRFFLNRNLSPSSTLPKKTKRGQGELFVSIFLYHPAPQGKIPPRPFSPLDLWTKIVPRIFFLTKINVSLPSLKPVLPPLKESNSIVNFRVLVMKHVNFFSPFFPSPFVIPAMTLVRGVCPPPPPPPPPLEVVTSFCVIPGRGGVHRPQPPSSPLKILRMNLLSFFLLGSSRSNFLIL